MKDTFAVMVWSREIDDYEIGDRIGYRTASSAKSEADRILSNWAESDRYGCPENPVIAIRISAL